MSIISWELTDISIARYGLDLRLPVYNAVKKLEKAFAAQGINSDSLIRDYDGNRVKNAFINDYLILREASHHASGDEGAIRFYNTSVGYHIKTGLYDALKGLDGADSEITRRTLRTSNAQSSVTIIAGNDEPIFVSGNDFGLVVNGTEAGFGEYNEETGLYSITIRVRNVITGTSYTKTVTSDSKLYEGSAVKFFLNDEITAMIDPGIIEISYLNAPDSNGDYGEIETEYYLFGMTPAEGLMPTDENDYIYTSISNDHSETNLYIGPSKIIRMPTTLNGEPLTVVGMTTFGYQDMEKVKIPNGVTKIE